MSKIEQEGGIKTASLSEFLLANAAAVREGLKKVIKPTFVGLDDQKPYEAVVERLAQYPRPLFARQARLVAAATAHLSNSNSLIISGEMGTGKTAMGVGIIDTLLTHKRGRVAIMSPTHLVHKWAAEIETVLGKNGTIRNYKVIVVRSWTDLAYYKAVKPLKKELLFFIFSKETAKLGYPRIPAYALGVKPVALGGGSSETPADAIQAMFKHGMPPKEDKAAFEYTARCPICDGDVLEKATDETDEDGNVVFSKKLELIVRFNTSAIKAVGIEKIHEQARAKFDDSIPQTCPHCGGGLRQPQCVVSKARKGVQRRLSLADYAQHQLPSGFFDLFIVDEIHELKGGDTGQGNAFGMLAAKAKKVVGLTGTLLNGYASSLFYIIYRMRPQFMQELGMSYTDMKAFVSAFGAIEEQYGGDCEVNTEGVVVKKGKSMRVKELPRVNPILLSKLLPFTIFLRLDEMNIVLPLYEEIVEKVERDESVIGRYQDYLDDLLERIADKDTRFLGSLASGSQLILDLPERPTAAQNEVFYRPAVTRETLPITNKEKRLVEIIKAELAEDRKCLVYITYSKIGTMEAVEKVLKASLPAGTIIRTLPENVSASRREAWLKANPSDILLVNPEKVKTGLDLLEYPTIVFHQLTYNIFTLKQSSRRSWRIGQTKPVRVYFLTYKDTPQQVAMNLIARKLTAANSLEGTLSNGNDLSSECDDGENISLLLARQLQRGIREEEDAQMSKIQMELRDNDPFEQFYLDRLALVQSKTAAIAKVEEAAQTLETAFKTVDLFVPADIALPPQTKQEVETALAPAAALYNADRKTTTVYIVLQNGRQREEKAIEMTAAEIQAHLESEGGLLQASLFDF